MTRLEGASNVSALMSMVGMCCGGVAISVGIRRLRDSFSEALAGGDKLVWGLPAGAGFNMP